jgi:hypothetical protein
MRISSISAVGVAIYLASSLLSLHPAFAEEAPAAPVSETNPASPVPNAPPVAAPIEAGAAGKDAPPAAAADPKAHFYEHGRIGILGALTEDMWKGGLVFEHQFFEAQVLAHYGKYSATDSDFHLITKIGGRAPLGTLNYFTFGGEFGVHPGSTESGVKVGGTVQYGPYIGLERYFAATPVMLCLWVNPYQHDSVQHPDATGGVYTDKGYHIFQTGGFGLAYLF